MRYKVATFSYSFPQDWQHDLFEQQLADLGFDVFDGEQAYIPTLLWEQNHRCIDDVIAAEPHVNLLSVEDCPDEDWNATWEESREPVTLPMDVVITPHCAFGAGHHETTSMMIEALVGYAPNLPFAKVLDMGCGTGVLGIMALKCGARQVTAVDMDENSVANAQENALANHVRLDVRLADTPPHDTFDLILANIHRNILISQMPLYVQDLREGGQIWLSGFLEEDIAPIVQTAQPLGLQLIHTYTRKEWRMIQLARI